MGHPVADASGAGPRVASLRPPMGPSRALRALWTRTWQSIGQPSRPSLVSLAHLACPQADGSDSADAVRLCA
jgi:hypothetical protein